MYNENVISLSFVEQFNHKCRRKRLGHGRDAEQRPVGDRPAVGEVRHTVAVREHHPPVLDCRRRQAWVLELPAC